MDAEKIVTMLRNCASIDGSGCGGCDDAALDNGVRNCADNLKILAADLIENQQREIETLRQANRALRQKWIPVSERIRELLKADRDGRVVVLPCKVGDTVIDQTFAENPTLMKNIRVEIAYESRCGIIFHMGYGIFANLVEHGRIKPVSEEAEEALRRRENG